MEIKLHVDDRRNHDISRGETAVSVKMGERGKDIRVGQRVSPSSDPLMSSFNPASSSFFVPTLSNEYIPFQINLCKYKFHTFQKLFWYCKICER